MYVDVEGDDPVLLECRFWDRERETHRTYEMRTPQDGRVNIGYDLHSVMVEVRCHRDGEQVGLPCRLVLPGALWVDRRENA